MLVCMIIINYNTLLQFSIYRYYYYKFIFLLVNSDKRQIPYFIRNQIEHNGSTFIHALPFNLSFISI